MTLIFKNSKNTASSGIGLYLIISVFFLNLYYPTLINHHISEQYHSECSYISNSDSENINNDKKSRVYTHAKCCIGLLSELNSLVAEKSDATVINSEYLKEAEYRKAAHRIISNNPSNLLHAARAPPST